VLPGEYAVKVTYGERTAEGTVTVLADPRFDIPEAERVAKQDAIMRAGALQEVVAQAVERIDATRADIDAVLKKARELKAEETATNGNGGQAPGGELARSGRELKRRLHELEKEFWTPPDTKGIPADTSAYAEVRYVLGSLGSSWDAPTAAQQAYLRRAEGKVDAASSSFNALFSEEVAAFRQQVEAAGIEFLSETEPLSPEKGTP
jgi:hypothetical protein